jgi:hypothetical protein
MTPVPNRPSVLTCLMPVPPLKQPRRLFNVVVII